MKQDKAKYFLTERSIKNYLIYNVNPVKKEKNLDGITGWTG